MKKFIANGIVILAIVLTVRIYNGNNSIAEAISNNYNIESNNGSKGNLVSNYDEYYRVIEESMKNYYSSLSVKIKNYDENVYKIDVVDEILKNNQYLMGVFSDCKYEVENLISYTKITFNFNFYASREVALERDNKVKNKIQEIINEVIKPEMKDYEKEKALHDYVINNCKYDKRYLSGDMPDESYTAYGALIEGTAVCQGYAVAMDMLLKAVGIESIIITGEAFNYETNEYISHAWNIVKIGGQYYHLDLTWDDPIMEDGSDTLLYSYFNINDEQIAVNHKWDESGYPKCVDSEYSFINLDFVEEDINGNDITVVKDYNEFSFGIKQDLIAGRSNITYRINNFDQDVEGIKFAINSAYESLSRAG